MFATSSLFSVPLVFPMGHVLWLGCHQAGWSVIKKLNVLVEQRGWAIIFPVGLWQRGLAVNVSGWSLQYRRSVALCTTQVQQLSFLVRCEHQWKIKETKTTKTTRRHRDQCCWVWERKWPHVWNFQNTHRRMLPVRGCWTDVKDVERGRDREMWCVEPTYTQHGHTWICIFTTFKFSSSSNCPWFFCSWEWN